MSTSKTMFDEKLKDEKKNENITAVPVSPPKSIPRKKKPCMGTGLQTIFRDISNNSIGHLIINVSSAPAEESYSEEFDFCLNIWT